MWKEIEKIYNRMQDEESKFIFRKRLEYNLCNCDIESLYSMAVRKPDNGDHSLYTLLKNKDKYSDNQPIIIFGAGRCGGAYKNIIENYKVGKLVAFCDNKVELHGTVYKGLKVLTVEEACEKYSIALFVLGGVCGNKKMKEQLVTLGIKEENIFGYLDNMRVFGCQYFDQDIIKRSVGGVFIDGGCLDLNDTERFIERNPKFDKVYAFEPSVQNYERCVKHKKEHLECDNKIEIIKKGLWSEEKQLYFKDNGGKSCISSKGAEVIEVTSIDAFMETKEIVTFIKMDIEGSELEALKGAKETIMRDKPNLAICIYHKNEDIVEIPQYILELNPDYKLYIRHYSCYNTETVLYAIMD